MNKELEALETLKDMLIGNGVNDNINEYVDNLILPIKQALHRLESIDNANPSEALECLETICRVMKDYTNMDIKWVFKNDYNTIKQALLKAQEQEKFFDDKLVFKNGCMMSGFDYKGKQIVAIPLEEYDKFMKQEKALEIIKEKYVDVDLLWDVCCLEEYNSEIMRSYQIITEEEFDIVREVLE